MYRVRQHLVTWFQTPPGGEGSRQRRAHRWRRPGGGTYVRDLASPKTDNASALGHVSTSCPAFQAWYIDYENITNADHCCAVWSYRSSFAYNISRRRRRHSVWWVSAEFWCVTSGCTCVSRWQDWQLSQLVQRYCQCSSSTGISGGIVNRIKYC